MRIGAQYGIGFDPYKDYTAILKKSINMKEDSSAVTDSNVSEKTSFGVSALSGDYENDDNAKSVADSIRNLSVDEILGEDKKPNQDINDAAIKLKGIKDFDSIGKDADIQKLDEGNSALGNRKDNMLLQYQFFVGTEGDDGFGSVMRKNPLL